MPAGHEQGEVKPIRDPQLSKHARQMSLDRFFGRLETARNGAVGIAFADKQGNLPFSARQLLESRPNAVRLPASRHRFVEETAHECSGYPDLALSNLFGNA